MYDFLAENGWFILGVIAWIWYAFCLSSDPMYSIHGEDYDSVKLYAEKEDARRAANKVQS